MGSELEKVKNQVLQKIGRNILLFQQMEHMLKYILRIRNFSGYLSEIKIRQKQKNGSLKKQTMGNLVSQFFEKNHSEFEETTVLSGNIKEIYCSFTWKIDYDAFDYKNQKKALASIVNDRNQLIHHLLPRLIPDSLESWLDTEQYLDQQHEKIIPEIDHLKSIIKAFQYVAEELKKQHE